MTIEPSLKINSQAGIPPAGKAIGDCLPGRFTPLYAVCAGYINRLPKGFRLSSSEGLVKGGPLYTNLGMAM